MHIDVAGRFDRNIDSFALNRVADDHDAGDGSGAALGVAEYDNAGGDGGAGIGIGSIAGDGVTGDQMIGELLENGVGVERDSGEPITSKDISDYHVAPILRARRAGENADAGTFAGEQSVAAEVFPLTVM